MLVQCDLRLDGRTGFYQTGEVVSGHVNLVLHERALIKAFGLKAVGYAETRWEVPAKHKKIKQQNKGIKNINEIQTEIINPPIVYTKHEDYLSTLNYFIGSEEALPGIVNIGNFTYNFSVRLPEYCVSSFESSIAHVRYSLDVFIDYADHTEICYSRPILVRKTIDLRPDISLREPKNVEVMENKSCVKFWQRPLQVFLNVPQTGYAPGEYISLHLKVLNYDQLSITQVVYKLNQICTYNGLHRRKQKSKVECSTMVRTTHSLGGQNSKVVQHLETLHLPNLPASTNVYTNEGPVADDKCIQIAYEVETIVSASKSKRQMVVKIPIKMGTISLYSTEKLTASKGVDNAATLTVTRVESTTDGVRTSNGTHPTAPNEDCTDLSSSMNSLNTTFKEATFMSSINFNKKTKHAMHGDRTSFKLKYLYYDMSNDDEQQNAISTEPATTNRLLVY